MSNMDVPPAVTTSNRTRDQTDSPVPTAEVEELNSFDPLEPPPLDWRSDCSSDTDEAAADVLTDFTDSLDQTSPNTLTILPINPTNDVQQKRGESVETSPVLEHVYASNFGKDKDKSNRFNQGDLEEPSLDVHDNRQTNKISENVGSSNLTKNLNSNFDKAVSSQQHVGTSQELSTITEEHRCSNVKDHQGLEDVHAANFEKQWISSLNNAEASNSNQQDASTSQANATDLGERSLDLNNSQQTNEMSENLCADTLNKNFPCNLDTKEMGQYRSNNFNQQDACASQKRSTVWEETENFDILGHQPTTLQSESINTAYSDEDLVCGSSKEVNDFAQQGASVNQERATNVEGNSGSKLSKTVMEDTFQGDVKSQDLKQQFKYDNDIALNKTKVYRIIETKEQTQSIVRGDLKHLEGGLSDFSSDERQIGKNDSEFDGKNPDLDNRNRNSGAYVEDEDHGRIQSLLTQLQLRKEEQAEPRQSSPPQAEHIEARPPSPDVDETTGLLFVEEQQQHMVGLLQYSDRSEPRPGEVDAVVSVSYSREDTQRYWGRRAPPHAQRENSFSSQPDDDEPEPVWMKLGEEPPHLEAAAASDPDADEQPSYKDVPGPCDPEDLLDGVIFGAKYLGSTQLRSDRTPSTNARMAQAQEAVDRIKAPEGETQPMTEVDLFISTKRIKVLTADTQEAMMDHPLQMISYIADIGDIVVLMARRKRKGADGETQKKCLMICHVFISEDAQVIAQAIGQAFGVAYQQFLQVNGIKASELRPGEYSHYLESQELYNGDLAHFSDAHNLKEVSITKPPGEMLGLAVVESGWGSILPTVVVANMQHGGPAERCGELSIGDRIMSVNGTSLVGLPIHTCQNIIRDLKSQKYVKLSIVHCPPVTMAIIRRPDPKYQLGFSVEDGIICSLMRGGIAERGGIRVGHRIIEINGQSVVATTHDKIIQTLTNAVGEIHLKTMPASTYRLLTGQEQPVYL